MAERFVHIVWSPALGAVAAYWNPSIAYAHASTMLGVDVCSIRVRDMLPEIARDDLAAATVGDDFEDDYATPPVSYEDLMPDKVVVDVDDLDEG